MAGLWTSPQRGVTGPGSPAGIGMRAACQSATMPLQLPSLQQPLYAKGAAMRRLTCAQCRGEREFCVKVKLECYFRVVVQLSEVDCWKLTMQKTVAHVVRVKLS